MKGDGTLLNRVGLLPVVLLAATLLATTVRGEPGIVVADDARIELSAGQLALLEDAGGSFSVYEVEEAWQRGEFESGPDLRINLGTTSSTYWARFTLSNPSTSKRAAVLTHDYAPTDRVDLYQRDAEGAWAVQHSGDSVPDTPQETRIPRFMLELEPGETRPVYVRIRTDSNLNFELSLWPTEDYFEHEQTINVAYGLLLGAILATVLYLGYSWYLLGTKTGLILALYLLSYGAYLSFLSGMQIYWVPSFPGGLVNVLHLAAIGLLFGFGAMFYRRFLKLRDTHPRLDRAVTALQWLAFSLLLNPLMPAPLAGLITLLIAGPGPLFTTGLAIFLWWRHRGEAGVFALGWFVAHISSFLGSLRVAGVLPNHELFIHLPALGCAVAMSFFAWAVAKRLSQDRRFAYEDPLTKLANRRLFEEKLSLEMGRGLRYGRPLSLIYLDVDHFKQVNDAHGHSTGDVILRAIAERCLSESRATDVVARIGGEEFAIILAETGIDEASALAERLRTAQADSTTGDIKATISLGVTEFYVTDEHIVDMMDRADEALYRAKREGRNRVEVKLQKPEEELPTAAPAG